MMHTVWSVSVAAVLAVSGTPASAQGIDAGVVEALTLSPDQSQAIAAFVAQNSRALTSEDPAALRRDRTALLEPLANAQASAAFRLEYGRALLPRVREMLSNPRELVVINGIVLAGDLATGESAQLLTGLLGDQRPAVRYQASFGLTRTFEAVRLGAPTLRADQVQELARAAGGRLREEQDALVVDALVRCLLAAGELDSPTAAVALQALADGLGRNLRPMNRGDASLGQSLIRSATGARDLLTRARQPSMPAEGSMAAAELAGHLLAHAARVVQNTQGLSTPPASTGEPSVRELYAQLSSAAETLVAVAGRQLDATLVLETRNVGQRLRAGTTPEDANFVLDARSIAGPDGVLTKAPFRMPRDRFFDR